MPRERGKYGPYKLKLVRRLQRSGPKGGLFFTFRAKKFYLRDFDKNGYHILSLSKNGYSLPFILKDVMSSEEDYVVLKEVWQ